MGIRTASAATGQMILLPLLARVIERVGWRTASAIVAIAALVMAPIAALLFRDFPSDKGLVPDGGTPADVAPASTRNPVLVTLDGLRLG